MRRHLITPRPERITTDGRVMLSHNHICLLKALHDQPGGRIKSRFDWIAAATPYQQRFSSRDPRWPLARAISSINRKWVREVRKGSCIEATLTKRGRGIIERRVPAWIVGMGVFRGIAKARKEKVRQARAWQQRERERSRRQQAEWRKERKEWLERQERQRLQQARNVVEPGIVANYPAAQALSNSLEAPPAPVSSAPLVASTVIDKEVKPRTELPPVLRRAIDFAREFGIPLLEPDSEVRTRGKIMAVTTGIDRFFRIACREELDMRVPRRLHLVWTRAAIDVGMVPAGYLSAFEDYDETEILHHLREVRMESGGEVDRYVRAYRGKPFLSHELRERWLEEEVDLRETDMTPECLIDFVRARSEQYRIAMLSIGPEGITWFDPETQKVIGRVVKRSANAWEMEELEVTTPAALSCLQHYWDETGIGLDIETRYLPRELQE